MRRLLALAYFFPPVGGVGVERTLKHASYLPELGWSVEVVAPRGSSYRIIEPASVSRVPRHVTVHRALSIEPGHLRLLARTLLGRRESSASGPTRQAAGGRSGPSLRQGLNAAWAQVVPLAFFPDEQLLWAPSAISAGWAAHRRQPFDLIYSSSPPISGHLAAAALRSLAGVPWVADFRDPWIGNAFARPLSAVHRRLQAAMERTIVELADRVVFASPAVRDRYAERYPGSADRLLAITNGYDLAELEASLASARVPAEKQPRDAFRLIYSGSLYGETELALLLDGVELLLGRTPQLRDRLRIELAGWLSEQNATIARRRLPALDPVVRHLGHRPREQAIAHLRQADAALILLADGPGRADVVQSKLYEYIGLDRQILAVAPHGQTRRVLDELGWGIATDPTPEGVADGLERLLESTPPERAADPERRYERRSLSANLTRVLDEIVAQREERASAR